MRYETRKKIKNSEYLTIIGITLTFGLVYNFFFYPHTLNEFIEAGTISIILGLIVGILEEFILKQAFQKMSSFIVTIVRTVLYSPLISIVLCLVLSIEISSELQITYSEAVNQYLFSPLFIRDFILTT